MRFRLKVMFEDVKLRHKTQGFTIIELMIATLIFASVMILLTFAVIAISQHYYKGVVQTNTQNTARSILAVLTQEIQFNLSQSQIANYDLQSPNTTTNSDTSPEAWFCIGDQLFAYSPGWQLVNKSNPDPNQNQTNNGFYDATLSSSTCPSKISVDGTAKQPIQIISPSGETFASSSPLELLGSNMRISNLAFTPLPNNLVQVSLKVTYGDNDLLVMDSSSASPGTVCSKYMIGSGTGCTTPNVQCTGQTGFQFCAYSKLDTVVGPRAN